MGKKFLWPTVVLLGIKEYKYCYLTANHNAYVVTQQSCYFLKLKDKSQLLSAIIMV